MEAGTARHEALEAADHPVVEVEVSTPEDALGIRLFNTVTLVNLLLEKGSVREVWVFGVFEDLLLRGIIDEIAIHRNISSGVDELVIGDTKTRRTKSEPSEAQKRLTAMQLHSYHWIVSQMREGASDFEALQRVFKVDINAPFQVEELKHEINLRGLFETFKTHVKKLPPLSDGMRVMYECDGEVFSHITVPYTLKSFEYSMRYLLEWWWGLRESEGVLLSEGWKCKSCMFLKDCPKTPLSPEAIKCALAMQEHADLEGKPLTPAINTAHAMPGNAPLQVLLPVVRAVASAVGPSLESAVPIVKKKNAHGKQRPWSARGLLL